MWRKNGPLQFTCLRVRLARVQLIGGGGAVVQWQAGRSVCSHCFHIWASDCLRHQTFAIYGHQVFWDKNQRHYMDIGFSEIWSETQSPKLSQNFVFLNYRTWYPTNGWMDGNLLKRWWAGSGSYLGFISPQNENANFLLYFVIGDQNFLNP